MIFALVIGLAVVNFTYRGFGPALNRVPDFLTRRTGGLAPALLAAFVVIQLTSSRGIPQLDTRALAVAVGALLLAVRAPFIVCVVAGAAAAALARAVLHWT
jgi:predicted branched-subunit amino acid permease